MARKMKKEIIINSTINEDRIAITEDGNLAELFIEFADSERSIGNIYLGKVTKVVPGINAAFIDIGAKQDAFLHFSDVDESLEDILGEGELPKRKKKGKDKKNGGEKRFENLSAAIALRKIKPSGGKGVIFRTKKLGKVHINLEPGQKIIVQVAREAYSSKGVKVTTKIGIPGRYTVLLPFDSAIGISRKITSLEERRRLRRLARSILPEKYGCIIRTAAIHKTDKELLGDWQKLLEIWKDIEKKVEKMDKPGLLYQDLKVATSVIRDLFTPDVKKVAVDSKKLYKEIVSYLKSTSPQLIDKVEFYSGKKPIFDHFGIEKELASTYERKVKLPSGGSIVIDQTEAMVVIDVNSGKSISGSEQEKTALETNLEAIKEIARQIRLRDIGGIILVDIIDMKKPQNKRKILEVAKKELSRDRSITMVYPLTQLSLLQITRQRINQNIAEKITEPCPLCQGTGRVMSKAVVSNAIERWLKNFRASSREFRLILQVHPRIAEYLSEGAISKLAKMMIKYFVKVKLRQNDSLKIDDFRFISVKTQKDITRDYL